MIEYIRKLQKKEEHVRKRIFMFSMAISMAVVAFVWIYGLGYRFNNKSAVMAKVENEIGPFELFKGSIVSAYKNVTASVGNITSIKETISKIEEGKKDGKQIDLIPVK
jgi:hypothetical protein